MRIARQSLRLTLRQRTLLLTGLILAVMVLLGPGVVARALVRRFAGLEARDASRDARQATLAISDMRRRLETLTTDWAVWDDTYRFINDLNPAYIAANLTPLSAGELRVNYMLFVSRSGTLVHGTAFDLPGGKKRPLPQSLKRLFSPVFPLTPRNPQSDKARSALVMLPEGPVLLASRAIVPSNDDAPARGYMVLGEALDADTIARLSEATQSQLTVEAVGVAPNRAPWAPEAPAGGDPIFVDTPSMDTIVGRALLRDVYDKPALVLRVDVPRVYFKEAFGEMISVLWLAGALSLVMALYVLYLLERHVLSRMERMSREVDRVADRRSLAQRLTVDERGDEISSLTTGINAMLASLQEAQVATAQSEQRRLAVLETMDEGLALVDCATGRILEANGALARMLGHPVESLRGALLSDALPTAPRPPYRDHVGKTHELLHQRGDGSEIALEALISTLREDTGCLACVLIRDATERHQVAQERNRLQEQLQQAQKLQALGQLAAGVAHNFNNVLAVIITAVELALMEAPPARRRALELALESATKAAGLVRQFVVFSRRQPLQKRPVSLPAVLGDVVEMCRKTFDRRLEVLLEVADEVPLVLGDASQLHGVILNICLNARDALAEIHDKDRPPQVRLRVETLPWPAPGVSGPPEAGADEYVRVTIADNGAGMDDATRERIFEPFFTTKEVGQGTGLGLSTAYAVVSEHGGWIDCRSEPGQGTEMSVYLPVAPVGQLPEGLAEKAPLPPVREGACLLVVDDEEALRQNLQEILAREGYHGLVAADGQEGLLLYARHHHVIQAVLLDLSMPRMSGWETLEQILALDPAARVIICTGYPIDPEELHGARTAILKPFNSEDLCRTVREVLEAPD